MKPFLAGERVTWKVRDHGKDKKLVGRFVEAEGAVALILMPDGLTTKTTVLARLNRCRGVKPKAKAPGDPWPEPVQVTPDIYVK